MEQLWEKMEPYKEGHAWSILKIFKEKDQLIEEAEVIKSMKALRRFFFSKDGINQDNFILFSTSGVHGTYGTIEDAENPDPAEYTEEEIWSLENQCVTFLIIQPRILCFRYGNVYPKTEDDFKYLKELRAASWKVM